MLLYLFIIARSFCTFLYRHLFDFLFILWFQTNLPVFKVKESSVRRRYSDFEWLRNELERDSKVSYSLLIDLLFVELFMEIFVCVIIIIIFCYYFILFVYFLCLFSCYCCCFYISFMMVFCQIVVPPLPGKALKRQLPFRGDDGIYEEEFIEDRRKGLEVFINK